MRDGIRSFGYWPALLRAVPVSAVLTATARRTVRRFSRWRSPPPLGVSPVDVTRAAAALRRAPRLFPVEPAEARALYRLLLPRRLEHARARALAILRGEIELLGEVFFFGAEPSAMAWHRDPRSGRRFDPAIPSAELDLLHPGPDPRHLWELARGAFLVELGVAASLFPDLAPACRARVVALIRAFLDENPPGLGLHYASPLEVALRTVNWLAALELAGVTASPVAAPGDFLDQLGGALCAHGRFLDGNLEDTGVVPANHLIGDLVGLLAIGLWLDDAAEARAWRDTALRRLRAEAARQVLDDGAAFEASTAYHRFTLELLHAADRLADAAGLDAGLAPSLHAMHRFVAGYLDQRGREPGFGDGDDGRCLPLCARAPRDHGYLCPLGAMRFGDAALKRPSLGYSEEAIWFGGAEGYRRWRALPPEPPPRLCSFRRGGVHVLRRGQSYAAMRCGGYGQLGVGGHAHNDQLGVVITLDGEPLVIDPGTYCYAADPVWRDRYRGTAAHPTVVVDGQEQSPLFDGRPFALPDGARARLLVAEDRGSVLRLVGEHDGYRRLQGAIRHRRELSITGIGDGARDGANGAARGPSDEDDDLVIITDTLLGRGWASVETRFSVGGATVRPPDGDERTRIEARLRGAAWAAGGYDLHGAMLVFRSSPVAAVMLPLGATPAARIEASWWSPAFGRGLPSTVIRFAVRGPLPRLLSVAIFTLGPVSP